MIRYMYMCILAEPDRQAVPRTGKSVLIQILSTVFDVSIFDMVYELQSRSTTHVNTYGINVCALKTLVKLYIPMEPYFSTWFPFQEYWSGPADGQRVPKDLINQAHNIAYLEK